MSSIYEDWAGTDFDWNEDARPSEASLNNAALLLQAIRLRCVPPPAATRGYWPTTRMLWDDDSVEVEVFDEHYELYVFPPQDGGKNYSIEEFDAAPQVSRDLLVSRLAALVLRSHTEDI